MGKLLRHVRSRVHAGNAAEDDVHGHRVRTVGAHVGTLAGSVQARDRRAAFVGHFGSGVGHDAAEGALNMSSQLAGIVPSFLVLFYSWNTERISLLRTNHILEL